MALDLPALDRPAIATSLPASLGNCCARFALADEWLKSAGRQSEGRVGQAHARLADSRDIVALALERLVADPLFFLHPLEAGCAECIEARQSVSVEPIKNMG